MEKLLCWLLVVAANVAGGDTDVKNSHDVGSALIDTDVSATDHGSSKLLAVLVLKVVLVTVLVVLMLVLV